MANTPFKLKSWSGYQDSPTKKKIWPPTKEDNTLEHEEGLREAKAKAIADEKAKHKAGKITKKQLDAAIKEINSYIDF